MQKTISARLLAWFDEHGRKNLPWQKSITPYRVWLSEIMLQQTQVETVIPYFTRFIESFPKVEDLAAAPLDTVLHLWTGLGYYARARNLHKCANIVVEQHQGVFPSELAQLEALPGIGPSTAAAIASIAFEQSTAILDGNVKRVLARYHAVAGWPGKPAVEKELWQHARQHMPKKRCRDYTQGIMDLGAMLCKRSKPECLICPLSADCLALRTGNPEDYPGKKPRKALPVKTVQMLIVRSPSDEILLEKRPSSGIWGGLWSLPEIALEDDYLEYVQARFGDVKKQCKQEVLRHTFSHYHLDIHPVTLLLKRKASVVLEAQRQLWYNPAAPNKVGLAAPVKKLIEADTPLFVGS